MIFFRNLAIVILLMAATAQKTMAQNVQVPKVYMFGFVASFNDSTVYFTDIQQVDSAWVTKSKRFLAGRSNYCYQLRNYCDQQLGMPKRTVVVIGSEKRVDVEKKYAKLKSIYVTPKQKKGRPVIKYDVKYLTGADFKFTPVDMSPN